MGVGEESRDLSPASLELVRCLQGVLPPGFHEEFLLEAAQKQNVIREMWTNAPLC